MVMHVQRVAHRGGSLLAPENTLAAFRNALTLPIDSIELDVQMSRDGQAIVFHDYTVERLTDGQGNLLDLDFAQLRALNAAAHFPDGWPESQQIPTLREVLDLVKGRVHLCIEIKQAERDGTYKRYPNIAEAVVHTLRSTAMVDQVSVISFDWSILSVIKSLEPGLHTGMNVSKDGWNPQSEQALTKLIEQAVVVGANWINLDRELFSEDLPDYLHRHALTLGVWTVNTLEELQRLARAGVDSLTTDRPDLFAQL